MMRWSIKTIFLGAFAVILPSLTHPFISRAYPDSESISFSGSFRTRGEFRDNLDMNSSQNDSFSFVNMRFRFGPTIKIGENLELKGTMQDSRIFGRAASLISQDSPLEGVNFTATNSRNLESLDIIEGLALLKKSFENFQISTSIGRQRLAYGEHRILGTFDWSNVSNSFDGVKISGIHSVFRTDVLGFIIRENSVAEGASEIPQPKRNKTSLLGIYNSFNLPEKNNLDIYLLSVIDGTKANYAGVGFENYKREVSKDALIFATGLRFSGEKQIRDFTPFLVFEGVYEFGRAWADKLNSFAMSGRIGTKVSPLKVRVFVEYDLAQGTTAKDKEKGIRRTFYNFFPTNHIHYGYADLFSWKNMHGIRLNTGFTPFEKISLSFDFWKFWLYTNEDWWYNAGQLVFLRDKLPYPSRDAGSELDLTLEVEPVKNLKVESGYSIFFPGELPRKLGKNDPMHWVFLQFMVNF